MSKKLFQFSSNWADEMDVYSYAIVDTKESLWADYEKIMNVPKDKRDEEGNLIMEHKKVSVREINEQGKASYHEEEFDEKIIDDQTILVADVFSNWKKEQGIIW